jgi:ABC-type nitrate/sulfonate/bicarbonate transport system substrate-binding protein
MKKSILFASLCWIVSVFVTTPVTAQALKKVKITVPRNSVFVLNAYGGRDAGIFKKHGIDLVIDPRPFKGHMAGLPAKEVMVTTYAGTAAIARINQGLDWVIIGGGLTVMQEVFVLKDSPYRTIEDLKGKKFASWSTGAGAFKATRAAIIDGYGFDVLKDTEFVQAAPPALFKLLERGQYWRKKTGQPIVWSGPLVAWRSWVNEDRARAKNFSKAVEESFTWLRKPENIDKAVKKYGKLAAVKNKAQAETYKRWLGSNRIFLAKWDKATRDKQWEFLEMAKKHGVLKKVPDRNKAAVLFD